jgi:hypothetical protein
MNFFLDLWHDLREKRLWPVAVGLLAAAVAIPLIMLKPAADPAPPVPIASGGEPETLPAVSVDSSPMRGSKLETFSERNPFKPLADLEKEETTAAGGSASGSSSGGGSADDGSLGLDIDGGSLSGGSPSSDGSGGGSTTPSTPDTPSEPEVQWYRYAVDLKFGAPDSMKTQKGVARLAGLPDDENPAVIFMGVSDDERRALFLVVDSELTADGEGECNDADDCKMIALGVGDSNDEATFTSADGSTQYDLQLLRIRRERMDPPASGKRAESGDEEPSDDGPLSSGKAAIAAADPSLVPLVLGAPDIASATR